MATTARPGATRRRGAELEHALYSAALEELADLGYGGLTMEGVAGRAGTGKAAVYRRWSGKHDLVLAALRHAIPPAPTPEAGRPVRENLRAALTTLCDILAGRTALPAISVVVDLLREPELRAGFNDEIVRPRLAAIDTLLQDAQRSGEIAPEALGPLAALTGPALIVHWLLLTGETPTSEDIDRVVDTVLGGADHASAPPTDRSSSPTTSREPGAVGNGGSA